MSLASDRLAMVAALDEIGAAAVAHGTRLDLAIYGGSALMLSSNFRFSTEDVDIAELGAWPVWLAGVVAALADRNGWTPDWLNEAVTVHLSPLAGAAADHMVYGSFPRSMAPGPVVSVLRADYMLALKLKAMRTTDPAKGRLESDDIFQLMRVLGIDSADAAMQVLARYFPRSARDDAKQRFLLKHLSPSEEARSIDAPEYPGRGLPESPGG